MDTPSSHCAFIGLGSNLGNSRSLLQGAWQALGQHSSINLQALSSPYRTQPVGMESEHWFINAVGQLETSLSPEALLDLLLATEQQFGRMRYPERKGHQDRTLDLDLLLFADKILETTSLTLPHPAMHERLFVLVPLAELNSQLLHPVFKKTVGEFLAVLAEQECLEERKGVEQESW
jgi:2-amino-4-hydroxy-6-hydroxymethyldihydropteridine diphosphokinase